MQSNRRRPREDKAEEVLRNLGVKKHIFLPSGKTIWTVVGREGDFLVDFEARKKEYCSCGDFYFRVLSGTVPKCYHLIAARRALDKGRVSVIQSSDEEYALFLRLLLQDVFSHIG